MLQLMHNGESRLHFRGSTDVDELRQANTELAEARLERDAARIQFELASARTCKMTEQIQRRRTSMPQGKADDALLNVDLEVAIDMQDTDYRNMKAKEQAYKEARRNYRQALERYRTREFQSLQSEVDSDSDLN